VLISIPGFTTTDQRDNSHPVHPVNPVRNGLAATLSLDEPKLPCYRFFLFFRFMHSYGPIDSARVKRLGTVLTTVLDHIPFRIDTDALLASLRVAARGEMAQEVLRLAQEAETAARPRGLYKIAFVESRDANSVVIDGWPFTSRVLRVNLDEVERVFPFVATCGVELEAWSQSPNDMFGRYCADVIKDLALEQAVRAIGEHLVNAYRPGATSMMHPGSLDDWPVTEQGNLFALLGDVAGAIGVRLTESFMMWPTKSVSGVWFPSEDGFESCRLCPREICPKRRTPYEPDLYDRKYRRG